MTVPRIFATQPAGNVPASYLDVDFSYVLNNAAAYVSIANYGAVSDWNGTTGTNNEAAVAAAIAAGAINIFIPANCLYKVTTNNLPDGVNFMGEDWNTSIISANNRATDSLNMGALANYRNVGIIGLFQDQFVNPALTNKICPLGYALNASDTATILTNWNHQSILLISGPQVTSPDGVISTDTPMIGITGYNTSDNIYTASKIGAAVRVVTGFGGIVAGAVGAFILNGWNQVDATLQTVGSYGIWIKDFLDGSAPTGYASQRISRYGNGPMLYLENTQTEATAAQSGNWIDFDIGKQSTGQIINLFQGTTAFSGNFISINSGNASGTFTGRYVNFNSGGTDRFYIDSNGAAISASTFNSVQGTVTSSKPLHTGTQTWNNAAAVFDLFSSNVTATAFDNASTFVRLQKGGVDQFVVFHNGFVNSVNSFNTATSYQVGSIQVVAARSTGWATQTAAAAKIDLGATPTVGQLASYISALNAALITHGLIGA